MASMRDTSEMPARVGAWLTANVAPASVTRYELITGGFSRDMASLDVEWESGSVEQFILRGDPPADVATFFTDRETEWHVLSALSDIESMPTPAARWFVDDVSHFGTKAIFIDFCEGGSLQASLDAGLDQASTADRFIRMVGAVANVSPDQLPSHMARPESWEAHLDGLIGQWKAIAHRHVESMPITRYIAAWLDRNRPAPLPLRLVHGDAQPGNIIANEHGWQFVDWEFARIGDPREDLGYYNAYAQAVPPNLALTDLDAYLHTFREVTGFSEEAVNPQSFAYFTVLSTAAVVTGMYDILHDMAIGERRGVAAAFNSAILVTIGNSNFLEAIMGLEAAS
jgi:aminoglycoside phosphotransferase (APT) family kinase protein